MLQQTAPPLTDARGRPLSDLRISVTDRCNFRCRYCMPREQFGPGTQFLPRSELLSFEELERVTRLLTHVGLRKVRLTGGEPLLRSDLPELVRRLAAIPGIELALTTNGSRLARHAAALAAAGLHRVTVSLDALDEARFRAMCDTDTTVAEVLEGIEEASRVGLRPVKINAVIRRGFNEQDVVALARRFRGTGHVVRFIEYMDVGSTNRWERGDVVTGQEILARLQAEFDLEPLEPAYRGEVARRWRQRDGSGEYGIITSVTAPFCGDCTRARLSAEGKLYLCLFASSGTDLRARLRSGASDAELQDLVAALWRRRDDRYSELRPLVQLSRKRIEMSYIGG